MCQSHFLINVHKSREERISARSERDRSSGGRYIDLLSDSLPLSSRLFASSSTKPMGSKSSEFRLLGMDTFCVEDAFSRKVLFERSFLSLSDTPMAASLEAFARQTSRTEGSERKHSFSRHSISAVVELSKVDEDCGAWLCWVLPGWTSDGR